MNHKSQLPIIPSYIEVASNFVSSLLKWVEAGFKLTTEEVFNTRWSICKQCPFWLPNTFISFGKCSKCNCLKTKLWLKTENCPLKLW